MEPLIHQILQELGEDPTRPGLLKTPHRVSKALQFMTKGYQQDAIEIVRSALFPVENQEIILVRDIDFSSLCEHHMLPFMGKAHVAYIPNGQMVGLSKLARVVDVYARRLQVQERLTHQIAKAIEEGLSASGVAVVMEATHLCMVVRGVQKPNAVTVTSCLLGEFRNNPMSRAEIMQLIQPGS